jgi:O-antigen/teichoic acid export membrane protein
MRLKNAKDQTVIHRRFAKNALANLGRGSAAAVVALLLPPVLVRHMTPAAYAVWILVLQTSAYISFLNLGLQTAVGRYVAFANEKRDVALRNAVFSTAFAALCCAALLSIACLLVAVLAAPDIFPSVPNDLVPEMRLALLIVGFAMAAELPASAWNGVFIGLQRFEIPALTVGGSRLLSSAGIVAAAIAGRSLVVMAAAMASANLLSYLAQYLALRRFVSDLHFHPSLVQRSTARELYGYCFGLTIMSLSMLLVSGVDVIIVGHFQFSVVTPYSVAASMITLISGLLYATINVLMPHAATLHAAERPSELGALVIKSTQLSVLLLVLSGIPILLYAGPILNIWIGQRYVAAGTPLLEVLIVANIIRLVGASYSVILVAAGQQSYIKISPLAEGISNFSASVALAFFLGGLGVALGTLLGSVISIGSHWFYSMVRTKPFIRFSRRDFLVSGVLYPLLATSPLLAAFIASLCGISKNLLIEAVALILSLGCGTFLYFHNRLGFNAAEHSIL